MLVIDRRKVKKGSLICLTSALATISNAAPTYLGLYLKGHKIGYASYESSRIIFKGKPADRIDSKSVIETGLLGSALRIQTASQTYCNAKGEPIQMRFQTVSQGRTQNLQADFEPNQVNLRVDNSGSVSRRTLLRPKGIVVDDPIELVLEGKKAAKCFILDPSTVSFIENEVRVVGKRQEKVGGKTVVETIVDILDPRANTRAYLGPNGVILRAVGPMGITMLPEPAAVAMAKPDKYDPSVDLAYANCIKPKGALANPGGTAELKLQINGRDLSLVPSDDTQTVTHSGASWVVDVHPSKLGNSEPISRAAKSKPEWTRPDLDMPSNSPRFKALARKIVGKRTDVESAAMAIKDWVYEAMRPNASIGVLRDATEVLKTKEGVCRDYAILTGTLLKSAGLPTRLASGLVNWDGTFYYHAWDEVWNGRHWIGIDSTTPEHQISAAHVKLASGTVAQAFTFAVLDNVDIQILASRNQ